MTDYFKGGSVPTKKYHKTILEQFTLKDEILYYVKKATDGSIQYIQYLYTWVGGGGVGSVMVCHSPRRDNAGSNPHATTDFSVTAEWPKTTHMLPRRPSINRTLEEPVD